MCMCYSKSTLSCNPSAYNWFGGTLKDTVVDFMSEKCLLSAENSHKIFVVGANEGY